MKTFGYIDFPPVPIQPFPGDQIPGNYGISGINISTGSFPVGQAPKVTVFQEPPPPPPEAGPIGTPPFAVGEVPAGAIQTGVAPELSIGGFIAQAIENFLTPPTLRAQQGQVVEQGGVLRTQPFEVPTLDLGFKPQRSGQVTGEIQTLNTGREFRPSQEIQTLDQGGHGGEVVGRQRTVETGAERTTTGGQQTLETIEQSRQDFQSGHFQDPPGELDYVAPSPSTHAADAGSKPCATCSMLNQDLNAKDSYPVEMIFHFKNHASAQRLGGLCEADGECEIA